MQIAKKPAGDECVLPIEDSGLTFKNPFLVGSGPTSKTVEQLIETERCGWAGSSIKLVIDPDPYINKEPRYRWFEKEKYHIFTSEKRLNLDEGLRLMEAGRKKTRELILFANITYAGEDLDGWIRMARQFEEAGSHALELNMCCPNMSYNLDIASEDGSCRPSSGASLGQDAEAVAFITREVVKAVNIPVYVKLTGEGSSAPKVAVPTLGAGAAGVGNGGTRLGVPPIDIYNPAQSIYGLQDAPTIGCYSGPWMRALALRDVYEIRKAVGPEGCILGFGGVSGWKSAIEMAMVGADFIGICTETMVRGFGFLPTMMRQIKKYMDRMGFGRWQDIRDYMLGIFKTADQVEVPDGYAVVRADECIGCRKCELHGHCYAIHMEPLEGKRLPVAVIELDECCACNTCLDVCPVDCIDLIQSEVHDGSQNTPLAERKIASRLPLRTPWS